MRQIKLFGLTFIFITLVANGQINQKNVQPNIPSDWKLINESSYSIQYPDNFELDKSGQMGTTFILLSQQKSQQDLFRENVNLIIQDLSGQDIDLDEFVEISVGQIEKMITDGNIIENNKINTGDSEYQRIIFTGLQGQFNLKFEQYYWIVKSKAYVLTLTCEKSQFENYVQIGEKIMSSFKIK